MSKKIEKFENSIFDLFNEYIIIIYLVTLISIKFSPLSCLIINSLWFIYFMYLAFNTSFKKTSSISIVSFLPMIAFIIDIGLILYEPSIKTLVGI